MSSPLPPPPRPGQAQSPKVVGRLPFIRRHPFLAFGGPFLALIVGSSFLLQNVTRTRYDIQKQKQGYMSAEELRNIEDKPFDIREFYYRLSETALADPDRVVPPIAPARRRKIPKGSDLFTAEARAADDWEIKRVERPEGVAEWGQAPLSAEERMHERERKLV